MLIVNIVMGITFKKISGSPNYVNHCYHAGSPDIQLFRRKMKVLACLLQIFPLSVTMYDYMYYYFRMVYITYRSKTTELRRW